MAEEPPRGSYAIKYVCMYVCMYVFRAQATPAGHVRDQN